MFTIVSRLFSAVMNKKVKNSVAGKQNAVIFLLVGVLSAAFIHVVDACHTVDENRNDTMLPIVSRTEWGAREARLVERFSGPMPFVVIHHSYIPKACFSQEACESAMRKMQDMHQLNNKWNDIGYSFAVGGDGRIYHGRGYNVIGAHAPRYNDKSIGICLIGDWTTELPPKQMLTATKALIEQSLDGGFLASDYKLLGHRQVRHTECPGQRLYEEISSWSHFSNKPAGPDDPEIPH